MPIQNFQFASGNDSYGITQQYFIIAGAIRNTGTGFFFIDDTDHTPVNMLPSITTTGTSVIMTYAQTGTEVVCLLVGPDETYAQQGICAGASVGLGDCFIRFGTVNGAINPTTLTNPAGNFWFFGIIKK